MTYKLYLLGIASFFLGACSDNEPVPELQLSEIPIAFSTTTLTVHPASKGGPQSSLNQGDVFGVMGYCIPQVAPNNTTLNNSAGNALWEQKQMLSRPHLFCHTGVTANANGGASYSPIVKWYNPADFRYTFFAYYPQSYYTSNTNENTLGAPKVTFSMPYTSTSVDSELNVTDTPDAMIALEVDVVRGSGVVTLNFEHLLTGLNFQINNYNSLDGENPGTTVTIHSLKLQANNFHKNMTVDFGQDNRTYSETYSGTFTILNEDVTVQGLTSYKIDNSTLLISDNGVLGGGCKILLDYTFVNGRKAQTIVQPANFLPQPGTLYTIQLNFIGDSFVLQFVPNDSWEDGGDSNITFE